MNKLHLHIDTILRGQFKPKKLNLLLLFQVNCPGCFFYAIPLFNQLFNSYKDQIGFLALSTAFEDFDLNTKANTQQLIAEGKLIGETKKALNQQGHAKLPYQLDFPIGMDKKLQEEQKTILLDTICQLNPNYSIWSIYDQNQMQSNVSNYLDQQQEISFTFTANQFKGTPTIVLFNEQNDLLESWFGHIPIADIITQIESHNS